MLETFGATSPDGPRLDEKSAILWDRYLGSLDSGRRRDALVQLGELIDRLDRDVSARSILARWLAEHAFDLPGPAPRSAGGIPFHAPLQTRVLLPYLLDSLGAPRLPESRWLVQYWRRYRGSAYELVDGFHVTYPAAVEQALALDPEQAVLWRDWFGHELDFAQHGLHHVADGHLSSPEREVSDALQRAASVAKRAPEGAIPDTELAELGELERLLTEWQVAHRS